MMKFVGVLLDNNLSRKERIKSIKNEIDKYI